MSEIETNSDSYAVCPYCGERWLVEGGTEVRERFDCDRCGEIYDLYTEHSVNYWTEKVTAEDMVREEDEGARCRATFKAYERWKTQS